MINEISYLTSIDKNNIMILLNEKVNYRNKRISKPDNVNQETPLINNNLPTKVYDDIIRLCFANDKKIRTIIFENLNDAWFLSDLHSDIYKNIYIHLKSEEAPPVSIIAEQINNKESRVKLIDLTFDIEKFNHSYSSAIDSLVRIEQKFLQSNIDNLRQKLRNNNNIEILEQLKSIEEKIKSVKSKYDQK